MLVLINTADAEATVVVAGLDGGVARSDYLLTADSLSSRTSACDCVDGLDFTFHAPHTAPPSPIPPTLPGCRRRDPLLQ